MKKTMKWFWIATALLLVVLLAWTGRLHGVAAPASAGVRARARATLEGRVVSIADGDTVTVLDEANERHKVRLAHIDAPERGQAYSKRSRQALSDLVLGKGVAVRWDKRDRYARILGRVLIAEPTCQIDCARSYDVGLALVRDGYAWWYRYYAREQTTEEQGRYEAAEAEARKQHAGLWADANPTPPWVFRKSRRDKVTDSAD